MNYYWLVAVCCTALTVLSSANDITVNGEKLDLGPPVKLNIEETQRTKKVVVNEEVVLSIDKNDRKNQILFVGKDVVGVIEVWKVPNNGSGHYEFNVNITDSKYKVQLLVNLNETTIILRSNSDDKIRRILLLKPSDELPTVIR